MASRSPQLAPPPGSEPLATAADCWNATGVYGNRTCPKLQEFTHCRNCPVYSAAGAHLLDRPLPSGYRAEWSAHYAGNRPNTEAEAISAVLCRLSGQWLALPTHALIEAAERRQIHSLPHRRHGVVLGLANVRGELLIAVSLGHLLGLSPLPSHSHLRANYARLLVMGWESQRLAFPVEEIQGPLRFPAHALGAPAALARSGPTSIRGVLSWHQKTAAFLSVDLLFTKLNQSLA